MAVGVRDARAWQHHADKARVAVLDECAAEAQSNLHVCGGAQQGRQAARQRRRAAAASAHMNASLLLATRTVGAAAYTCGGCGTWLFRATDLVPTVRQECDVSLTDSPATVCEYSARLPALAQAFPVKRSF